MRGPALFLALFFVSLGWNLAKNGNSFIPMMSVRLDKCKSYCNPKYCNITTICRPLNRTSKFVYMDISLHPGVKFDAPIYVHVMTLKQFATVYRPTMINVKTEVCKELALRTHPLMFGLWKDKTNSGNLLDPCPMEGHRHTKARITNVYDFVSPLLPLLPIGQWRFDTILSTEINGLETVVVSWNDYYEIKPLTAEQF